MAYPFSTAIASSSARGFQQVSFEQQVRTLVFRADGQFLSNDTETDIPCRPAAISTTTAAFVYDTSVFGATSPVSGQRSRFEVTPTFGSLDYTGALADYRRYFMPARFYTIAGPRHALRPLRERRRELDAASALSRISGVRARVHVGSFSANECAGRRAGTCEMFDRLLGSRLLVANLELRFPLLRPFGVSSGMYGPVPVEVAFFADGGVAWTKARPSLFGGDRDPVSSTGVSFRANMFGFAVAQIDFAYPFQRPDRGWVWAFNLMPGF